MSAVAVQVVIPVKRLTGALRRLGAVLRPAERALMQEAMLRDMLTACAATTAVGDVLVVSSDPTAQRCARDADARYLPDHDPPRGMNAAVAVGQRDAAARGHVALVLTADLPLVTAADIDRVALCTSPGVVLVPSHTGEGTNALRLDPAGTIATCLGPRSRAGHRAAARDAGCGYAELVIPRIALDIDTPDDLGRMLRTGPHAHTRTVAEDLDLAGRLTAAAA